MSAAPAPSVSVMDVLKQCGWVPDPGSSSDGPALKYHFGNFELAAGTFTNFHLQRIISFCGIYDDYRSLTQIQFDCPEKVASRAQVLAWVAYGLRNAPLVIVPSWLEEGRHAQALLPWEQEMAAYRRRPQATVSRDWMRVLAHQLRAEAEHADEMDTCRVRFDGEALRFKLRARTMLVQASGEAPWSLAVIVNLLVLRALPKRWMNDPVDISYWKERLTIGNRGFDSMTEPCDD
jgi:hypothetical protein